MWELLSGELQDRKVMVILGLHRARTGIQTNGLEAEGDSFLFSKHSL